MFESCRAHRSTKRFLEGTWCVRNVNWCFVLCLPPSRNGRVEPLARGAKAYWDSLALQQEAWALRKMGFHRFGSV